MKTGKVERQGTPIITSFVQRMHIGQNPIMSDSLRGSADEIGTIQRRLALAQRRQAQIEKSTKFLATLERP